MKTIIGITGTTSVGKSAVGVKLAQRLHSEIVSADSMQIYKGMDIGTAKINACETCGIVHHMIDIVEPCDNYSSFLYQQQASQIIDRMDTIPVVVGGTGFYFDSLIYPPEFGNLKETRRKELRTILDTQGLDVLRDRLKQLDAETYGSIDLNNPQRVLRAVEIAESGASLSQGIGRNAEAKYNLKLFVLERSRDSLYTQIDSRVDKMIDLGLVDEVKTLVNKYGVCDTSAFQAIGYKEIIEYLRGSVDLSEAIGKIKINTRHYAKRQITYFKKMNVFKYINVECKSVSEITDDILNSLD